MQTQKYWGIIIAALLLLCSFTAQAQRVTDGSYRTVAHIKDDGYIKDNGAIQDANYRTIGHADGIPKAWVAWFFFF